MPILEDAGFEVVGIGALSDQQLGRLCRKVGTLASQQLADWMKRNPHPHSEFTVGRRLTDEESAANRQWSKQQREIKTLGHEAIADIVDLANGAPPSRYGGALALFYGDDPKMYMLYHGHNDDPEPDWVTMHSLYSFDGFLDTPAGPAAGQAFVDIAMRGHLTSTPPESTLGSIPQGFFEAYLKPRPAAS